MCRSQAVGVCILANRLFGNHDVGTELWRLETDKIVKENSRLSLGLEDEVLMICLLMRWI